LKSFLQHPCNDLPKAADTGGAGMSAGIAAAGSILLSIM